MGVGWHSKMEILADPMGYQAAHVELAFKGSTNLR